MIVFAGGAIAARYFGAIWGRNSIEYEEVETYRNNVEHIVTDE